MTDPARVQRPAQGIAQPLQLVRARRLRWTAPPRPCGGRGGQRPQRRATARRSVVTTPFVPPAPGSTRPNPAPAERAAGWVPCRERGPRLGLGGRRRPSMGRGSADAGRLARARVLPGVDVVDLQVAVLAVTVWFMLSLVIAVVSSSAGTTPLCSRCSPRPASGWRAASSPCASGTARLRRRLGDLDDRLVDGHQLLAGQDALHSGSARRPDRSPTVLRSTPAPAALQPPSSPCRHWPRRRLVSPVPTKSPSAPSPVGLCPGSSRPCRSCGRPSAPCCL